MPCSQDATATPGIPCRVQMRWLRPNLRSPVLRNRLALLVLAIVFYGTFALQTPALLDDADSVHAEVAREMLLRHDWVTLYANGIRYLEKAPLLYWSMALSMRLFGVSAVAARLPLALTVLALALLLESFARRLATSANLGTGNRTGLLAGLITLSSFGIFIFTRITIPDAMVCLWLTVAILCYWLQLERPAPSRALCWSFAAACALGVLTKGLIGVVFPVGIVLAHLLATDGPRATLESLRQLYPASSTAVFFVLAAPWHLLAGLANPTQGHPAPITFTHGHWIVPLPTDGNIHGWFWFYFVNEHLLRYLNLRVPRDYDTVPLWLFLGLVFIWLMPWSLFLPSALADVPWRALLPGRLRQSKQLRTLAASQPILQSLPSILQNLRSVLPTGAAREAEGPAVHPTTRPLSRSQGEEQTLSPPQRPALILSTQASNQTPPLTPHQNTLLLLGLWAALPLAFFSLSTRQEYYVLPALPAMILLLALWLTRETAEAETFAVPAPRVRAGQRLAIAMLVAGSLAALAAGWFVLHAVTPTPTTDLASLLAQNPADYALSFGHFLDLNAHALGAFRGPLLLTALAIFLGPLGSWLGRRAYQPFAGNLALAAGAFTFLYAAHLGLRTFAPVLSSAQLAAALEPELTPPGSPNPDLLVINGEYESASTLGFYLHRPFAAGPGTPAYPAGAIHILNGRSSNLWYGSFFPDAPHLFETDASLARLWQGPTRIFLWTDPVHTPTLPGRTYQITKGGGKEILSNQPSPDTPTPPLPSSEQPAPEPPFPLQPAPSPLPTPQAIPEPTPRPELNPTPTPAPASPRPNRRRHSHHHRTARHRS